MSASVASASPLPAAGDEEHLWIVQRIDREGEAEADGNPDAEAAEQAERDRVAHWLVRHRAAGDPPDALDYAGALGTEGRPMGVAASQRSLWVVDPERAVHVFRAAAAEARPGWTYVRRRGPTLPEQTDVRALGVGDGNAFALVRVSSSATLHALDEGDEPAAPLTAVPSEQQILRWLLLDIPPEGMIAPEPELEPEAEVEADDPAAELDGEELPMPPGPVMRAEPDEPEEPETDAPPEAPEAQREEAQAPADDEPTIEDEPVDVDRLLQHRGGRWRSVALPESWSHDRSAEAHVALLAGSRDAGRLRLLVQHGTDLRIYQRRANADAEADERWSHDDYALERAAPVRPMVLEGQLAVAQIEHDDDASAAELHLSVLRRGAVRSVGTLRLSPEDGRVSHSGAAPMGDRAALIVESDRLADTRRDARVRELWWARMNLRGEVEAEPAPLRELDDAALEHLTDYIILVAVVALAILMMLLFWRRDASQFQLALPPELALGSLPRRVGAGALDLAPPVAVAMGVFEIGFAELPHRWPGVGQAHGVMDVAPGALAIGLFVAHTLLGELFFGRSFGKALLGLRVSTLRGERPRIWQLLVRNVLKSFDLIAWLLLVLVVIGPFRQRLGDLMARTVVVMPVEPPAQQQRESEHEEPPHEP